MYISYNWLKELADFSYTPAELEKILTMLGIEVDAMTDYARKYQNFYTAKVLKKEKHPNADKLTVCEVDSGKGIKSVVCGAPNVEAGQSVVLGLPGAVVPQNGMVIEKRQVRKIDSDGMLCSRFELDIAQDHSGIWILPEETPIGRPLAEYLNSNDTVFEISVTPNRSDCLSHFGVAREIIAYRKVNEPDNINNSGLKKPVLSLIESGQNIEKSIEVIIDDPELCPRYSARIVRNAKISESPEWLKQRLTILGLRPVNCVVDVTNLVLLECGQPLHAFDLDEIADNKIIVRRAEEKQKFTTLDGKERILDADMLMICDGKRPVAIGGVMGGENSEISLRTTNILIESAYFKPGSIRRTSKKLGIQSEASYRFERGVDIENTLYALDLAAMMIAELTGGIIEKGRADVYPLKKESFSTGLRYQRARDIIGSEIPEGKIRNILTALNFHILKNEKEFLTVEVPSYRVDIFKEIDLVEEIARLDGYVRLEPDFSVSVSSGSLNVPDKLSVPALRGKLADYLVKAGFHEVLTQNIIDPVSASFFGDSLIRIANPLGEELSVMRPAVLPSLLKTIEANLRYGNTDIRLFEIGKSFHKTAGDSDTFIEGIRENEELIIAIAGNSTPKHWDSPARAVDLFDLKGILSDIIHFFRLDDIKCLENKEMTDIYSGNSLLVQYKNRTIGTLGTINKKLLSKFGIEADIFILQLDLGDFYKIQPRELKYRKISPFPAIVRDLAFILDESITSEKIGNEIAGMAGNLLTDMELFDVYKGKNIGEGKKSLAFSLKFSSPERTLVETEVDDAISRIITAVEHNYNAVLRKF